VENEAVVTDGSPDEPAHEGDGPEHVRLSRLVDESRFRRRQSYGGWSQTCPPRFRYSTMALPGLEPHSSGSDEGRLGEVAPAADQVSRSYRPPTSTPGVLEAGLSPVDCSNVANALRDLLDHAQQQGIDMDHPSVWAAFAALEELEKYAAS